MRALFSSLVSLAFASLLTGCASSTVTNFNRVHLGMAKADVLAQLGSPEAAVTRGNIEYLTYYLGHGIGAHEQPYMVRLVDARVESFGRCLRLADSESRPAGDRRIAMNAVLPYSMNLAIVTTLEQLKAFREREVLTEEEYQRVRARVLTPE